jgi:lipopolysaccharide/colanic/teichoic acid biosynthesis glycosyltransferase
LLVLGEKYSFTQLELDRLNKKFFTITQISYKNEDPNSVIEKLKGVLTKDGFTVVVLNTKAKVDNSIIEFLTKLKYNENYKNVKIISIEHFLEKYLHKCYIPEDNNDLHYLDDIKPFNSWQYIQKRAIDYFGLFWLFICSFWVYQKCKFKIVKESPGPYYFKQDRVGFNNQEFTCIKFRSMKLDAEKDGVKFASKNDSRVFSWGEYMRKRRYDELPQMINILKGEMHLIGPRPERKYWIDQFEKDIPYYNERHIVRPGVTGWAQVMYPYGEGVEDTRQKLMYDLYYIKHWNILLELKIVWKTAMVVLHKKGV